MKRCNGQLLVAFVLGLAGLGFIQSRAAEYSTFTPFISIGGGLLTALIGFFAGLIGRKPGAADTPNLPA